MRKILKFFAIGLLIGAFVWIGGVMADRQSLRDGLIRLHIVANSDSQEDQALKLQIRDAVTGELERVMAQIPDMQQAKEYLQAHLEELESLVNRVISEAGFTDRATVMLGEEAFDIRCYDTFTLPSGVYESLRITIGEGEGKNWWCVVFPTLCVSATSEGFEDTAAGSGFQDSLTGALSNEPGYEVRFFFLDCLGKLENFFFGQ